MKNLTKLVWAFVGMVLVSACQSTTDNSGNPMSLKSANADKSDSRFWVPPMFLSKDSSFESQLRDNKHPIETYQLPNSLGWLKIQHLSGRIVTFNRNTIEGIQSKNFIAQYFSEVFKSLGDDRVVFGDELSDVFGQYYIVQYRKYVCVVGDSAASTNVRVAAVAHSGRKHNTIVTMYYCSTRASDLEPAIEFLQDPKLVEDRSAFQAYLTSLSE